MWFTWANLLTVLRLASIGPCAYAVIAGSWRWAAVLFAVAVATDLLDGPVARRYNHASNLGGLLDHATDALFVVVTLGALAHLDYLPWLLPCLVVTAFIQYTLDSRALAGSKLRTSWLGRLNGVAYYVVVGIPVIRNGLELAGPDDVWINLLAWLLITTTVVSMFDRARAWFIAAK